MIRVPGDDGVRDFGSQGESESVDTSGLQRDSLWHDAREDDGTAAQYLLPHGGDQEFQVRDLDRLSLVPVLLLFPVLLVERAVDPFQDQLQSRQVVVRVLRSIRDFGSRFGARAFLVHGFLLLILIWTHFHVGF